MSDPINELLNRGVDTVYPTREALEKVLRSGKKLTLYQGFDPTGSQLHLGHMVGLRKMRQWQDLGHHVIFLIGDFTAMIGDPSGKTTARKVLTHEEVLENAKNYKEQAGKVLLFEGENPVEIKFNGDWLGKMSALEFLQIAHLLSVQQVVERDMFQERKKQGQDIYMNEFLYPVMQAYDSVAMNIDLEIGGTDQMFNMLMGRKLMRHMLKKDKFVMTTPILADSQGVKIGKTEGNVIALNDKPEELFGKIMGLSDDVIVKGLEYLTDISMEEIEKIKTDLQKGRHPVQYKKLLAYEIVKQLNNEEEAHASQTHFENTIQKKELPKDIPVFLFEDSHKAGNTIADIMVSSGLAVSKSEARRLIEQGGVTYNNEKVEDAHELFIPENGAVLQVGKRNFRQIRIA